MVTPAGVGLSDSEKAETLAGIPYRAKIMHGSMQIIGAY
jgi:hypothetical protein